MPYSFSWDIFLPVPRTAICLSGKASGRKCEPGSHSVTGLCRGISDVLAGIAGVDKIFEPDVESLLVNKDYKDLMTFGDTPVEKREAYEDLSTDTTAARMEMKSKLISAMSDLAIIMVELH